MPAVMTRPEPARAATPATIAPDAAPAIRVESFACKQLVAFAGGRMFGAGYARLPSPPVLMFDRISRIPDAGGADGKGEIDAELDVRPDHRFFDCRFAGDARLPRARYATIAPDEKPLYGTLVAFKRVGDSFHGRISFEGERRIIQVAWVRSVAELGRKVRRGLNTRLYRKFAGDSIAGSVAAAARRIRMGPASIVRGRASIAPSAVPAAARRRPGVSRFERDLARSGRCRRGTSRVRVADLPHSRVKDNHEQCPTVWTAAAA